jgi:hypothetical protein
MARAMSLSLLLAGLLLLGRGAPEAGRAPASHAVSDRPAGTLVFTTGTNRLTAIDVASGRRTVRRVPAVAACGPQMYVTAEHLVFAGVRDGVTVVLSVPVTLDEPPTRLGAAHAFVPSATPGRVWLAGVNCDRSAMTGVREVTVDGRTVQESGRRVPGTWLEAAVPSGLVVLRSRDLLVWNPATGETGSPLGLDAVTDTHGGRLAGCSADTGCRGLVIEDAATAEQVEPDSRVDFGAKFSPDGALVAAPVRAGRRWRIALVDARTGKLTTVPGSRGRHYPELAWAESSGWLFARTGSRRLMAYRPGLPRALTLPFRSPRGALSYVAG